MAKISHRLEVVTIFGGERFEASVDDRGRWTIDPNTFDFKGAISKELRISALEAFLASTVKHFSGDISEEVPESYVPALAIELAWRGSRIIWSAEPVDLPDRVYSGLYARLPRPGQPEPLEPDPSGSRPWRDLRLPEYELLRGMETLEDGTEVEMTYEDWGGGRG